MERELGHAVPRKGILGAGTDGMESPAAVPTTQDRLLQRSYRAALPDLKELTCCQEAGPLSEIALVKAYQQGSQGIIP